MRVLIIEDNAVSAFFLRRLLESIMSFAIVTVVNNSQAALTLLHRNCPDMVIVDGHLGALNDGSNCNGPELADTLLQQHPNLPLIAWSDSESMRDAFARVFREHNRPVNNFNTWAKVVSAERVTKTLAYYFGGFSGAQNTSYSNYVGLEAHP